MASHSIGEIETRHEAMSDTELDAQLPLSVADVPHKWMRIASMRRGAKIPLASTRASTEDRNVADVKLKRARDCDASKCYHIPVGFSTAHRRKLHSGRRLHGVWWFLGFISLRRILHRAVPADAICREAFREIAGAAGNRVVLLVSNQIEHPFTSWWHCPAIVLPTRLTNLENSDVLKWCLAHEWSHVDNGDLWRWHLAGVVLSALLLPAIRCGCCVDTCSFARIILPTMPQLGWRARPNPVSSLSIPLPLFSGRPVAALGINGQRSTLSRRVLMLVQNPRPLKTRCPRIWSGMALVVTVMFVAFIAAAPRPCRRAVAFADSKVHLKMSARTAYRARGGPRLRVVFSNESCWVLNLANSSPSLEISASHIRIALAAARREHRGGNFGFAINTSHK